MHFCRCDGGFILTVLHQGSLNLIVGVHHSSIFVIVTVADRDSFPQS